MNYLLNLLKKDNIEYYNEIKNKYNILKNYNELV